MFLSFHWRLFLAFKEKNEVASPWFSHTPDSVFCNTCLCSHISEQVNIYVSQFMYIQYMTSDLFYFLTVFYSGQKISQSVRVYITRLLTWFVSVHFFFFEGSLLLFTAYSLYFDYSDSCNNPICIGFNLHLRFSRKFVFVCKVTE